MKFLRHHPALLAALVVLVLSAAVFVRFYQPPEVEPGAAAPAVFSQLRQATAPGWRVSELPLGDTELVQAKVEQTLQFDHAVFLRFQNGSRDFAVYLAHWWPGKASPRTVRGHTPDVCWPNAGWMPVSERSKSIHQLAGRTVSLCEFRRFEQHGVAQEVVFWHLLNGQVVPFWTGALPSPAQLWRAFRGEWRAIRGEQYFLRVSTSGSMEEIERDPFFQQVMSILGPLGVVPADGRDA